MVTTMDLSLDFMDLHILSFSVYRTMDECDKSTYHTSPRVIYSLYHNNCPICLLFIEVLPKMSIKPSKTHEIKTWKITKYFCSVISYFGKTYHTLPQCDLDS